MRSAGHLKEESMSPITPELLQAVCRDLARLPLSPEDAAVLAAQVSAQVDGLSRLDELELGDVEPATVFVLPAEVDHARE
jgi:Asp-tRNA(Asn)/Glu-tRNA(Gln) amidotransferase C subunit